LTDDERILRLTEHRSGSLEDSWVQAVPASFWEQTKTTVTRAPGQDGWSVQAEAYVGIARVHTELGPLTLHISPKLNACDPFFLADYAYGQRHQPLRHLPGEHALVDQVRNDPAACLLLWHVLAIHRFSARWLRRDQVTLTQELHGKVKGSIQLSRYINKHVAVADAATIPCRVRERTQDTPNNRILKAGLRRAATLARSLPVPGARRAVHAAVNAALPIASPRSPTYQAAPATFATPPPKAPFGTTPRSSTPPSASSKATTSAETSDRPAPPPSCGALPTLFQEALRGVLTEASTLRLIEDVPTATIHDATGVKRSSSKVDPDYVVLRPGGTTLLLDAKYKHAASTTDIATDIVAVPGARRIRVPRADIYQMAAYRQHDRWATPTGALVYPISLHPGEPLPAPYQVRGFGQPIHICFMDVGPEARANLPRFLTHIDSLTAGTNGRLLPASGHTSGSSGQLLASIHRSPGWGELISLWAAAPA
jgi:5-methylcytosine-specific restriction enzyme subunit McrC